MAYGLSRNGYVPSIFEWTNERGVPWVGLIAAFITGCICFLPFPSWQSLVGLITSASVLMYAGAPLSLSAFRKRLPDQERPFRLPAAEILSPVGFAISSLIILWTTWDTDWKLGVAILIGYVILIGNRVFQLNEHKPMLDWRAAAWLPAYLVGMGVIVYISSFGPMDDPILPFLWDMLVTVLFSFAIFYWAIAGLPEQGEDRGDDGGGRAPRGGGHGARRALTLGLSGGWRSRRRRPAAIITSTAANRSSLSHSSRRVSTRPAYVGGQCSHGVKSSRTTMPPSSTRSQTLSGPAADGLPESRNSRENGPLSTRVDQSAATHLDLGVVLEDLGRGLGQLGVELGGHDPRVGPDAGAQPGGADAAAGAELRQRAPAGRGQRREQAAGLVAAERDRPGLARHREGAVHDLRELGGSRHAGSLSCWACRLAS